MLLFYLKSLLYEAQIAQQLPKFIDIHFILYLYPLYILYFCKH